MPSGRRLTDEVQLKLRFQEGLRYRLERRAKQNGRSLNAEIIQRLHDSFHWEGIREEADNLLQKSSFDASAFANVGRDLIKGVAENIANRMAQAQVMARRLSEKSKDDGEQK
jgi:hypothetical protein